MASTRITGEERIGLLLAALLHGGLLTAILMRPAAPPIAPPERIEVTLSPEVTPVSRAPEPAADAALDTAPNAGDLSPEEPAAEPEPAPPAPQPKAAQPPAPPKPQPKPEPKPEPKPVSKPVLKPVTKPTAKPVTRTVPKPTVKPVPQPVAKPAPKPVPKATARPVARPTAQPVTRTVPKPAAKPQTKPGTGSGAATKAPTPTKRPGASRIGDDFLKGTSGAKASAPARLAVAEIGADARSSLLGGISRELRPHWQGKVPEGADSEKLVTVLRWSMNTDGSLAGAPQVVRQEGITEANRPQASRHAEQAIRAVQLAAPFALDDKYYEAWKRVTIKFDKRLSQ